jgi:hypothetical protein
MGMNALSSAMQATSISRNMMISRSAKLSSELPWSPAKAGRVPSTQARIPAAPGSSGIWSLADPDRVSFMPAAAAQPFRPPEIPWRQPRGSAPNPMRRHWWPLAPGRGGRRGRIPIWIWR